MEKKPKKTRYHVRIDSETRAEFMETIPWGDQGNVIEALINLFFEKTDAEGAILAVAKLTDDRYELVEREKCASKT